MEIACGQATVFHFAARHASGSTFGCTFGEHMPSGAVEAHSGAHAGAHVCFHIQRKTMAFSPHESRTPIPDLTSI